jgi:hypothetical protein
MVCDFRNLAPQRDGGAVPVKTISWRHFITLKAPNAKLTTATFADLFTIGGLAKR